MPTVPQNYLHYKQSHQQTQNNVNLCVKNAATVTSLHCTNTRCSYAFHFCTVTEQSDVPFAFSVHVNGTVRPDGEKPFQSAHIPSRQPDMQTPPPTPPHHSNKLGQPITN
jgi:hypothetical protein